MGGERPFQRGQVQPPPVVNEASGTSSSRTPASGPQSKNGGYTGGLITTASPGRVRARSSSTTPTPTSVTPVTWAVSTSQPQRRAANLATARPRSGVAWP